MLQHPLICVHSSCIECILFLTDKNSLLSWVLTCYVWVCALYESGRIKTRKQHEWIMDLISTSHRNCFVPRMVLSWNLYDYISLIFICSHSLRVKGEEFNGVKFNYYLNELLDFKHSFIRKPFCENKSRE